MKMNNYFKTNKKAFLLGILRQAAILSLIAVIFTITNFSGFNIANFGIWITALILPILLNSYILLKNYKANKKIENIILNSGILKLKDFNFEEHWYSESKFDLKELTLKSPENLIIKPKSKSEIEILNLGNIDDLEIKLKEFGIPYSLNTYKNFIIVKDLYKFVDYYNNLFTKS